MAEQAQQKTPIRIAISSEEVSRRGYSERVRQIVLKFCERRGVQTGVNSFRPIDYIEDFTDVALEEFRFPEYAVIGTNGPGEKSVAFLTELLRDHGIKLRSVRRYRRYVKPEPRDPLDFKAWGRNRR